ncbi:hypothetical protein AGR1B_pAt30248 [Agrobacterium fabacearum S56]|nr:hypothetical protein AGR1B_pAt30248 [Agrobacterium fabacearum S56]
MNRERRVHMIGLFSMWIGITSGRYTFITEQINIREKNNERCCYPGLRVERCGGDR